MHRTAGRTFFVLVCLLSVSFAAASTLEFLRTGCLEHVQAVKGDIQTYKFWSGIIVISGALIAAVGSALAGFATKGQIRKISGICGAIGAMLAVAPKLLPDASQLQNQLFSADSHRLSAEKVFNQMEYFDDSAYIRVCRQYVISRYLECAADVPNSEVPPLPSLQNKVELLDTISLVKPAGISEAKPQRTPVQVHSYSAVKNVHSYSAVYKPASPEDQGYIMIKSSPPFADLTLNGRPSGSTPTPDFQVVPIGKCRIRIAHRSYSPLDTVLTITSGEHLVLIFKLDRK